VLYTRQGECRCRQDTEIYILEFLQFDPYAAFGWLMNTKQPSLHLGKQPGTLRIRRLDIRSSTPATDSVPHWPFQWHLLTHLLLRSFASQSKLSISQLVPTGQPSNQAANAWRWKKHTLQMSENRKYVIIPFAMLEPLLIRDFPQGTHDIA